MIGSNRQEIVKRYKANYGIPLHRLVTEEMVLEHWQLEQGLRAKLLASTPADRWEVFEQCYSELYSKLAWLNQFTSSDRAEPSAIYANWIDVIGPPPQNIYEVGSGKGLLIRYLAACGHRCKATEITRERGEPWISPHPNLSWGISDGVHLERFEPRGFYHVVISDQVIEHLHPDDLLDHFRGAGAILANGGRYVFSTPHVSAGPSDVSRVFGCNTVLGMHLKEYSYREIASLLVRAGFKCIYAILRVPWQVRGFSGGRLRPAISGRYLRYLCLMENIIAALPGPSLRRPAAKVLRLALFAPEIMMVAEKD